MFNRKVYIISITVYSYTGEDYVTNTTIHRCYRRLKPAIDYSSNLVKRTSNGYVTAYTGKDMALLNAALAPCKTSSECGVNCNGYIHREYQYFEPIPNTLVETRLKVSVQVDSYLLH